MKDKTILKILTMFSISGLVFLFKKGPIKDWFLIYLFKSFITALIDGPVVKKKLVTYPYRYFSGLFDTNIIFDFVLFPLLCVFYSQFTYKMKLPKIILSVLIFSVPMTVTEVLLARYTGLIKFSKKWSWFHTFSVLTGTFWASRIFIASIRFLNRNRKTSQEIAD